MISCRPLTKRFGELTAVDGVAFEVASGSICVPLGPNGAGKSTLVKTLVKMMTGLIAADSGDAVVGGLDVARQPLDVRRIVGVLPENLGLFDDLTIEEHLLLCGPIYGLTRAETDTRGAQLLRLLAIEYGRDTFASARSHGMRTKTALAMALLHNPRILFLDEPFEGIDPVSARAIRHLLRAIAARGVTVFLTSHILSLTDQLADQVLMIRSGKIVWNSLAAEVPGSLEVLCFELVEAPRGAARRAIVMGSKSDSG